LVALLQSTEKEVIMAQSMRPRFNLLKPFSIRPFTEKIIFEAGRLTHERGILSKVRTTIPIDTITDYNVHAGFVDGLMGMQTYVIQTAGRAEAEMVLRGYSKKLEVWLGQVTTREFRKGE
jgi:membrane protein YdbS with pleckstrin-like domain